MDTTPIVERLSVIARAVHALQEVRQVPLEEFVQDYFLHSAAERSLQVAIQAALDIGNILLSRSSTEVPKEYAEIFPAMASNGLLPPDFAARLSTMAKFRNVLVHMYAEIDLGRLHAYLQTDLDDFSLFCQYIAAHLEK
ncbi:MAG: DUF86 domain-containing protein [Caldilineaceae bacterium]